MQAALSPRTIFGDDKFFECSDKGKRPEAILALFIWIVNAAIARQAYDIHLLKADSV